MNVELVSGSITKADVLLGVYPLNVSCSDPPERISFLFTILKVMLLRLLAELGENVIEHDVRESGCRPVNVLLMVAKVAPESGAKSN